MAQAEAVKAEEELSLDMDRTRFSPAFQPRLEQSQQRLPRGVRSVPAQRHERSRGEGSCALPALRSAITVGLRLLLPVPHRSGPLLAVGCSPFGSLRHQCRVRPPSTFDGSGGGPPGCAGRDTHGVATPAGNISRCRSLRGKRRRHQRPRFAWRMRSSNRRRSSRASFAFTEGQRRKSVERRRSCSDVARSRRSSARPSGGSLDGSVSLRARTISASNRTRRRRVGRAER